MEVAANGAYSWDLGSKIMTMVSEFRLSNIEKVLSDMLENTSNSSAINYVGELNKNDVMH